MSEVEKEMCTMHSRSRVTSVTFTRMHSPSLSLALRLCVCVFSLFMCPSLSETSTVFVSLPHSLSPYPPFLLCNLSLLSCSLWFCLPVPSLIECVSISLWSHCAHRFIYLSVLLSPLLMTHFPSLSLRPWLFISLYISLPLPRCLCHPLSWFNSARGLNNNSLKGEVKWAGIQLWPPCKHQRPSW